MNYCSCDTATTAHNSMCDPNYCVYRYRLISGLEKVFGQYRQKVNIGHPYPWVLATVAARLCFTDTESRSKKCYIFITVSAMQYIQNTPTRGGQRSESSFSQATSWSCLSFQPGCKHGWTFSLTLDLDAQWNPSWTSEMRLDEERSSRDGKTF